MNIIEKIDIIKEIYPKFIIFVKVGSFYNAYKEDSNILSYLFGYKLKTIENSCRTCGFQITSSSKVFSILKEKQINYLLIDKRKNDEIIEKIDFKRKNQYKKFLNIAEPYIKLKIRLEVLCRNILENINEENFENEIEYLEEILYKDR